MTCVPARFHPVCLQCVGAVKYNLLSQVKEFSIVASKVVQLPLQPRINSCLLLLLPVSANFSAIRAFRLPERQGPRLNQILVSDLIFLGLLKLTRRNISRIRVDRTSSVYIGRCAALLSI